MDRFSICRSTGKSCRSRIYTFFLSNAVELEPIFTPRAVISEMDQFSKLLDLVIKIGNWQKVPEIVHTFYTPRWSKLSLFLLYGQQFRRGDFSKLPYLGMKLGHWQKFQKLHIYSLSTIGCQNSAYFRSTCSGF